MYLAPSTKHQTDFESNVDSMSPLLLFLAYTASIRLQCIDANMQFGSHVHVMSIGCHQRVCHDMRCLTNATTAQSLS